MVEQPSGGSYWGNKPTLRFSVLKATHKALDTDLLILLENNLVHSTVEGEEDIEIRPYQHKKYIAFHTNQTNAMVTEPRPIPPPRWVIHLAHYAMCEGIRRRIAERES